MKINLNQLSSHLQNKLAPCYFVTGDEPLLVDEALDSIRESIYEAAILDFNLPDMDGVMLHRQIRQVQGTGGGVRQGDHDEPPGGKQPRLDRQGDCRALDAGRHDPRADRDHRRGRACQPGQRLLRSRLIQGA